MTLYVLDVSNHQAGMDIGRAAAEGFVAVSCKATEGVDWVDPTFDVFIPQVKAAGLIPGAYHYLRAGDGAEQARQFHARVVAYGGPAGWLIQLDAESDGYAAEMTAWAAQWSQLTGGHPFLLYSSAWWWPRTHGFRGADLTPYLWSAHYVDGSAYASQLYEQVEDDWWRPGYGGWDEATLLQFTDRAVVAGRLVDASAFLGTLDDLRALTQQSPTEGAPVAVRVWPNVQIGSLGTKMALVLAHSPRADELWISSGMDGDHGPRPNGSHHYGLEFQGSPTAAVDFVGNSPGEGVTPASQEIMRDTAKWLYDNFANLTVELIHTTPYPDDDGFYVLAGTRYPGGGPYAGGTAEAHRDHGHWAVSEEQVDEILTRLGPPPPPPTPAGGSMADDYGPYGPPPDDDRTTAVRVVDLHSAEESGESYYVPGNKTYRTLLLDRVDAGVKALVDRPHVFLSDGELDAIADTLVARVAAELAPKVAAAVTEKLDRLADEMAELRAAVVAQGEKAARAARAEADALGA